MADAQTPIFTPAHRVVLDCMGYVNAKLSQHDNHNVMMAVLAEVLPHAPLSGHATLDRVVVGARAIAAAHALVLAKDPGAGLAWGAANLATSHAMQEFFIWRAAKAIDGFRATLGQGDAA